MGADPELRRALDMLVLHPARILRLPDHGPAVGDRADLVIWEAERAEDVVAALAPCRLVVKASGSASSTRGRWPWREP